MEKIRFQEQMKQEIEQKFRDIAKNWKGHVDRFAATKTAKFTPRKIPENGRLSVRRVLVFLQVDRLRYPAAAAPAAGHPSLRSGRPKQAHVFPPQSPWIARLLRSFNPFSANKAAAREPR